MIIKQLSIGNFGKIKDKSIELKEGINVVYGKNEQGKTTVHQFIESFFSASRDGFNDQYDKYRPWNGQENFKGDMELEINREPVFLSSDFNEETITGNIDENSSLGKQIKELTVMNLLGVREINTVNSKEFIREIQHRIVNIKNVTGIALDYEKTMENLINEKEALDKDRSRANDLHELKSLKASVENLKKDIKKSHEETVEYFQLKRRLADELKEKVILEDSIKLREFQDKTLVLDRVDVVLGEIEIKGEEIENNWIYSKHAFEDVEYVIDAMGENMQKEKLSQEISMEKEAFEDKLDDMGIEQSEKAIHFLSDNLYGEDFLYDVRSYETASRQLKVLESDVKVEEYKQAKLQEEEDQESLNDLEHDYVNLLNLRNKRNSVIELTKDKDEFIANKTKLGLLQERNKPLKGFLFMAVLLLAVAIVFMVVVPSLLNVALALSLVLLIIVVIMAYLTYHNRRQTSQLAFVVDKLQGDQDELTGRLKGIDLDLQSIFTKHKLESTLEFEHHYIKVKNELLQKVKMDYSDIEDKINDLTFNRNMLKRRVDKWLSDCELSGTLSSDQAHLETKVKEHIAKCSDYAKMQREAAILRKKMDLLEGEMNSKVADLRAEDKYAQLVDVGIDELLHVKGAYLALSEEKSMLTKEKETLLKNLTYEQLVEKLQVQEELIKTLDQDKCYPESIQVLNAKLNEMIEKIVKGQQKLETSYKNLASMTKTKLCLRQELTKVKELKEREEEVEQRISIYNRAIENLRQSADEIRSTYELELTKSIGQVLGKLTGVYDEVIIDGNMNFFVKDSSQDKLVALEELSRGLLDQLYFAVRIGLMDTVNENLETPLVLDDCFVHYDDERLENVLSVLYNLKRQIIILTCQKREQQILEETNMNFNNIVLA